MKKKNTLGFNVGDVRISYCRTDCGPLSVIAKQVQNQQGDFALETWKPESSKLPSLHESRDMFHVDESLEIIEENPASSNEMIANHRQRLRKNIFVSKCIGTIFFFFGAYLFMTPIFLSLQQSKFVQFLQK